MTDKYDTFKVTKALWGDRFVEIIDPEDPEKIWRVYFDHLQREWVGLTDEEKESMINKKIDGAYLTVMETIEFVEAKLKEKNHA
jgi:hypothetical protein